MAILPKSVTGRESLQLETIEENRDKNIPQIWQWGQYSPFYRGALWENYKTGSIRALDGNLLYTRVDGSPRVTAFTQIPQNNYLITNGLDSVLSQIPNNTSIVSPKTPKVLYVGKNATYEIVVPNYNNGTITRYNLRATSLNNALKSTNPITQRIADLSVDILDKLVKGAMLAELGGAVDLVPSLDDIGAWYISSTETAPLKPISSKSILETVKIESVEEKKTMNPLPLILGAIYIGSMFL